jgi:hypothetical protein
VAARLEFLAGARAPSSSSGCLIDAESVAHGLDACPVSQRCKEQECQVCRTEPRGRRWIVRARETHSVAELDNRDELSAACIWTGEQPVELQPNAIRSRDGDSSSNNHCGGRKGERRRCLSTTRPWANLGASLRASSPQKGERSQAWGRSSERRVCPNP